jgi:hypothetical protein
MQPYTSPKKTARKFSFHSWYALTCRIHCARIRGLFQRYPEGALQRWVALDVESELGWALFGLLDKWKSATVSQFCVVEQEVIEKTCVNLAVAADCGSPGVSKRSSC